LTDEEPGDTDLVVAGVLLWGEEGTELDDDAIGLVGVADALAGVYEESEHDYDQGAFLSTYTLRGVSRRKDRRPVIAGAVRRDVRQHRW
jgi:hypothetical protein